MIDDDAEVPLDPDLAEEVIAKEVLEGEDEPLAEEGPHLDEFGAPLADE